MFAKGNCTAKLPLIIARHHMLDKLADESSSGSQPFKHRGCCVSCKLVHYTAAMRGVLLQSCPRHGMSKLRWAPSRLEGFLVGERAARTNPTCHCHSLRNLNAIIMCSLPSAQNGRPPLPLDWAGSGICIQRPLAPRLEGRSFSKRTLASVVQ